MRGLQLPARSRFRLTADPTMTRSPEPKRSSVASRWKTPGKPRDCVHSCRSSDMVVIDDNTVIFRDTARRVYRNDFRGGSCGQLGSGFYTLVTKSSGSGLCSGDLAQVVDTTSGFTVGSCVIGDFVPYEGPPA